MLSVSYFVANVLNCMLKISFTLLYRHQQTFFRLVQSCFFTISCNAIDLQRGSRLFACHILNSGYTLVSIAVAVHLVKYFRH